MFKCQYNTLFFMNHSSNQLLITVFVNDYNLKFVIVYWFKIKANIAMLIPD